MSSLNAGVAEVREESTPHVGTMFTVNISAEFVLAGRAHRLLTAFQHRG